MIDFNKFKKLDKHTKDSILIIALFSIIVLSLTSIYYVSGDACWQLSIGRHIGSNFKIPLFEQFGREEPFWAPPLYHFVVAIIFYFFSLFNYNMANTAVKFISPIFGILTLIFSFLTIKKLVSSKIAFYSTLFTAFLPLFMDYSIFSYVESMLTFLVVLSVYFLVNGRILLSSIVAGLSILTKYNGIFIVPVLFYFVYKINKNDKKLLLKNLFIVSFVSLLIPMAWFIRNWLILGNPIWPFLNFIFKGFEAASYSNFNGFWYIFNINTLVFTYLGFFGVPDGNPQNLLFFDVAYLNLLLTIWAIGTLIFILPLVIGFFINPKKSKIFGNLKINNFQVKTNVKYLIYAWTGSYLVLFLLYVANVGWSVSRMLLPAVPAFAVLWAFGFDYLLHGFNYKNFIKIALILIIAGLVFTEIAKILLASAQWNLYNKDFEWVKANTGKNDIIMAGGQCLSYNFDKQTLTPKIENLNKADYIWVNQKFKLDQRAIAKEYVLLKIKENNYEKVYENKKTGTLIYKVKQ